MKMLVFDDEAVTLFLLELTLIQQGHEVFAFKNCDNLLETVSFIKPDLIFIDNIMPGITGFEATQQLKTIEDFSKIPVIFYSGSAEAEQLAKNAKADLFLPKPFTINELKRSIETLTGKQIID